MSIIKFVKKMFATVICLNQHFLRQSDNFQILDVNFEERKDVNNSANVKNLNIRNILDYNHNCDSV